MDETYTPVLKLYLNNETGSFVDNNQTFTGIYTSVLSYLDFNNDGFVALISTENEGTSYYTYLYQGISLATYANVSNLIQNVDGINIWKVTILDYDNNTDDVFYIMSINNEGD